MEAAVAKLVLTIALPIVGIVLVCRVMGWKKLPGQLLGGITKRLHALWPDRQQRQYQQQQQYSPRQYSNRPRCRHGRYVNPPPQPRQSPQQQLPAWRQYKWHEWKRIGKKQGIGAWFVENVMGVFVDLIVWSWLFAWWVSCTFVYKPVWNYAIAPAARFIGGFLTRARSVP